MNTHPDNQMKQFFVTAAPLSVEPIEINGKTKLVKAHKLKEKRERRRVAEGYPITSKFETVEQVKEYLNGSRITCLLCGRSLKQLCTHLSTIHRISAEDYKVRYGLPFRCGLSSVGTREKARAIGSRPEQLALLKRLRDIPGIEALRMAGVKKQRTSELKAKVAANLARTLGPAVSPYDVSHAEIVLSYMERNDCSLRQAVRDTKVIGMTAFLKLVHSHPETNFEERMKAGSRGKRSPISGKKEVIEKAMAMCADGRTQKSVAAELGIHEVYLNRLIARTKGKQYERRAARRSGLEVMLP